MRRLLHWERGLQRAIAYGIAYKTVLLYNDGSLTIWSEKMSSPEANDLEVLEGEVSSSSDESDGGDETDGSVESNDGGETNTNEE